MLRATAIVAFVLLSAGCAEKPPPAPGPPATLDTKNVRSTCPLGVDNAHVTFDETANGATLVFSTTPDRLEELRRRTREAAERHGTGKQSGEGHDGKHGLGGGRHGLQAYYLPPSKVTMVMVDDGARLTFTPDRLEDVDALRKVLRYRVERMMAHCS